MDAKDLERALTVLGWTGADLAARVDAHPNTVTAWRAGRTRIPGAVAYALTLAQDIRSMADSLAPRPSRRPRRRPGAAARRR